MAITQIEQDQRDNAIDKLAGEKAFMIMAALGAGGKLNTADMIEHLDEHLGDGAKLADLVQRTARGENALFQLLNTVALQIGERQAEKEIAERERRRNNPTIAERINRYLDSIAA